MIYVHINQSDINKAEGFGLCSISVCGSICLHIRARGAFRGVMVRWGRVPVPRRVSGPSRRQLKQFSAGWGWRRTLRHVQIRRRSWNHDCTSRRQLNSIISSIKLCKSRVSVAERLVLTWLYATGFALQDVLAMNRVWTCFNSKRLSWQRLLTKLCVLRVYLLRRVPRRKPRVL